MGSYLGAPQSASVLTRKGLVLALLVGLHALAIAGLMKMGIGTRAVPEPEQPVEVVLLREALPEAPLPPSAPLQPVALRPLMLPEVDVPLVDAPASPNAITVMVAERLPTTVESRAQDLDVPIRVDQVEYLSRVPPRYPVAARRARAEGTVYLHILIDQDGHPQDVRLHRSCGHQLLDDAAMEAARRFRFKPHRVNGMPRNVQAIVPIEFALSVRTARSH